MENSEKIEMIKKFQCPGCSLDCSNIEIKESGKEMFRCESHSAGTILGGVGKIYLGMPKGFDKVGAIKNNLDEETTTNIRFHSEKDYSFFDKFNLPICAREVDGYLFIRTFCWRINRSYIDVIKGGNLSFLPSGVLVLDEFIDDFD